MRISLLGLLVTAWCAGGLEAQSDAPSQSTVLNYDEKDLLTLEVITGPFEVDRRYKSMEGPMQVVTISPLGLHKLGKPLILDTVASALNVCVSW